MRWRSLILFTALTLLMAMTVPGAASAAPPDKPDKPTELFLSITNVTCEDGSLSATLDVRVDAGSAYLVQVGTWADKWMARDVINGIDGVGGEWDTGNWSLWYGDNIGVASWSNDQSFDRRSTEFGDDALTAWTGSFNTDNYTRRSFTNAYVGHEDDAGWWHVNAWARASVKGGDLWSQGGDDSGYWIDCGATNPVPISDGDFTASLQYCEQDSSFEGPYMWAEIDGTYGKVPCEFTYPIPPPTP